MRPPPGVARIAILTTVHHPFDQRVFYKEAVSLAQAGYEVVLLGPAPASVAGVHHGVRIEPLPMPASRRQRLALQGRLLGAARRLAADIYHLHDPELLPLGCALRGFGHRVIYDVHENFPAVALTRSWVPRVLRRPLSLAVELGERGLAQALSGVVGVVEDQAKRFRHCRFETVRNYPRLEWFAPAPATLAGAEAHAQEGAELIHVGSLSHERGAHFLLEIMRQLRRTHPGVCLDALGPFHTRADEVAFRATVRAYGLEDAVRCRTDYLPYDQLGGFIAGHRVGLIPGQVSAKNLTPFVPTKLFEYLACGLPVVASALPSIDRFHRLADWGVLADPGDPRAHARAIVGLLDDGPRAAAMGGRGRQLAESVCNWETEAAKLLRLYQGLLEAPDGPSPTTSRKDPQPP